MIKNVSCKKHSNHEFNYYDSIISIIYCLEYLIYHKTLTSRVNKVLENKEKLLIIANIEDEFINQENGSF